LISVAGGGGVTQYWIGLPLKPQNDPDKKGKFEDSHKWYKIPAETLIKVVDGELGVQEELCDVDPGILLLENVSRQFHGNFSCVGQSLNFLTFKHPRHRFHGIDSLWKSISLWEWFLETSIPCEEIEDFRTVVVILYSAVCCVLWKDT
jgi:hypothetical protein